MNLLLYLVLNLKKKNNEIILYVYGKKDKEYLFKQISNRIFHLSRENISYLDYFIRNRYNLLFFAHNSDNCRFF